VKIKQATENSLRRADELGINSIAFPALGTGVGGVPLEECARIMIAAVMEHTGRGTGLERVVFVLFGEPAYRVFKEEMERQTPGE
jgi:O-acetyl-ADP-ribose deacetylase (regulator of RNase III)